MRLGIRLRPQWVRPAISFRVPARLGAIVQRFFSWQAVGAALLGIVLAKWTWALLAPASPAMPAAGWEGSGEAARLFGTAPVQEAPALASASNIKLIGVFAHRTQGFAVLQMDDKQIGVALGEEVKPGIRLVETYADHVVLEQGGASQRVDLSGASAPSGAAGAPPSGMAAAAYTPQAPGITAPAASARTLSATATAPGHTGQMDALQQQLNGAANMPPERREMLQRQLDKMRGQH